VPQLLRQRNPEFWGVSSTAGPSAGIKKAANTMGAFSHED
jgi:hypothetical protein